MTTAVEELVESLWPGRAVHVERLTGGMTNANFLADFGDEKVVVRIPGHDTSLLGINRNHEVAANKLAASIGVAPEVLNESAPQDFLVTRFLEGRPVLPAELATEPMLREVITTLHHVHDAGTIPAFFNPFEVVRTYHEIALNKGVVEPFDFPRALSIIERVSEARRFRPVAFCHNDLLNENFLFDDQIRIIDWEYAAMGDPFFDLAFFSINHGLLAPADERLLTHYFGYCDAQLTAVLNVMKLVTELREAMWGVVQLAVSTLDFDFAAYTQGRADRFMTLYEAMDFEEAISHVDALSARLDSAN
ncbi:MAG: choline/ethanolamine kinase family protein [Acidimicrobiales bacterium]|jgi:thiamine kinase-like enzyme